MTQISLSGIICTVAKNKQYRRSGFTIVELLIVIVVIAILAAISVVAYNGIRQRAIESSLAADISNANKLLGIYHANNSLYPATNACPASVSSAICLTPSGGASFNYTANSARTGYSLTVTNSGTSMISYDGSSPERSYGSRVVSLANMVNNGNFNSGLTGWTNNCLGNSVCGVTNGALRMSSDGSARAIVWRTLPGVYNDGDKVFYSANVKRNSGSGMVIQAHRNTGGYAYDVMSATSFNGIATGSSTRVSGIRIFLFSQGTYTSLQLNRYVTGVVFDAEIDNIVAINLTSSFGVGNEPSVTQMEAILSQFPDSYFDGTINATY